MNISTRMPQRGLSGHRGGVNNTHPENTLVALKEGLHLRVHQIEFDTRVTKDGHVVLMHDPTVNRTTDGEGNVCDLTLSEIRSLDAGGWKDVRYSGERVPTLREALSLMPSNIWVNIHVKEGAEMVAREILHQRRTHQAFLAVNASGAQAAKNISSDILICNMERYDGDVPRYIAKTIEQGHAFIQLVYKHGIDWPQELQQLKAAGVRINFFRTNEPGELATLYDMGIDFPLVDDLPPMMAAAQALNIGLIPR